MLALSAPSLDRLLRETRNLLNQPREENSFWSNEELIGYLNDGTRTYFLDLSERAEGQFDKVTSLDITSGTETVALPSDCYEIRALYKKSGDYYQILNYENNLTQSYSGVSSSSGNGYAPSYYLRGNNLVLRDVPSSSETAGLKLEYTAFPEVLIWGGDSMVSGISPVFKELVIMYAVYKAKVKEDLNNGGNNSAKAAGHLGDLYKQFKDAVSIRSKYPQFIKPFSP